MKNGAVVNIEIHQDVLEAIKKLAEFSNQTPEKYLQGVINLHAALGSPVTFMIDEDQTKREKKKLN
jgi:hypothetical protein